MHYKVTGRDWINLIAAIGIIVGVIVLLSAIVTGVEPNANVEEPVVIFTNPNVVDAKPVQMTDPNSVLTEIDIPELTEYVDPEPIYTPEPNNPPENPQPEPPEAPESDDYDSDVSMDDVEMLACVVYQEVGGDAFCSDCRYYVADIVLNRMNDSRFPNTIYGVLTQQGQYGRFYWTGIVWPERAGYSGEAHAVERAYQVARDVLSGNHSSLYGNDYVWQAGFVQGTEGFWCCGHYYARG